MRHKRQDSDGHVTAPWLGSGHYAQFQNTSSCQGLQAANTNIPGQQGLSSRDRKSLGLSGSRENSGLLLNNGASTNGAGPNDDGPSVSGVQEATFRYRGVKVRVKSTPTRLSWKPAAGTMGGCCRELSALHKKIPYDEVLAAWCMPRRRLCGCLLAQRYQLVVYALERPAHGSACEWSLVEHRLTAPSADVAKEWVTRISAATALCHDRPRNLLVFINPFSGGKRARSVWEHSAQPIFEKARIKFHVVETLAADYARDTLSAMKADELAQYQGLVAVGGDGVFQECMIGLLAQRARGGANAAAAARIRLGHIPGGSTDAVAYSLHGTRSAEAAALHIALGDRMVLDVARVDCIRPPHPPAGAEVAPGKGRSAGGAGEDMGNGGAGGNGAAAPPSPDSAMGAARHASGSPDLSTALISSHTVYSSTDPATRIGAGNEREPPSSSNTSSSHSPAKGASTAHGKAQGGAKGSGAGPWPGAHGSTPEDHAVADPPVLAHKYFVCQAAYGFLGDVMKMSERLRFLGPPRYDVAGFLQFLRLRSYKLRVSYRPAPSVMRTDTSSSVCSHKCEACRLAGISLTQHTSTSSSEMGAAGTGGGAGGAGGPPPMAPPAPTSRLATSSPFAAAPAVGGATGQAGTGGMFERTSVPVAGGPHVGGLRPQLSGPVTGSSVHSMQHGGGLGTDGPSGQCGGAAGGSILSSSGGAGMSSDWVTEEGEYISVMAVVTPCRSERSKRGIIPHAHLADGRIYLVLVSKCHHLDYLRFLLHLSHRGLEHNCLPFVQVVPVCAVSVTPVAGGSESCWNVDGELLPSNTVRMRIARGLLDVFARGVELEHPAHM